ncbi:MAG: Pseudopaline exporter CntI [Chlamydiae bacterium]|nr:Pseudopaline exporter CntI [Chlamydiota bacterium]
MTSKIPEQMHNPSKGIPLVLLSCFAAAGMATAVKLIGSQVSSNSISLIRFLISLVVLIGALPFIRKKKPLKEVLKVSDWRSTIVRILSATATLLCYFYAIQKIPLSTAVVIIFSSPLYIPIISLIWKKIPIPPLIWWPLLIGFAGVVLIVGPDFSSFHAGFIAGVVASVLAAISYVATRVQAKCETPYRMNFYLFLFGSIIIFLISPRAFVSEIGTFTGKEWLLLGIVGFSGLIYQYLLSVAVRTIRIRFAGAFLYFTIIFAFLGEWLFFNKTPSFYNYLGVLMIMFSGVLMTILDTNKNLKI